MTFLWKLAHFLYKKGTIFGPIAKVCEVLNYMICSNSISAKAEIGEGTKFWHRGLGCTVHYKVVIGKNCRILPNVMIGSSFKGGMPDEETPFIGNNVFIGTGAVIVGNITIGDNSIVGANAVVLNDVPANCYALGIPASIIPRKGECDGKI